MARTFSQAFNYFFTPLATFKGLTFAHLPASPHAGDVAYVTDSGQNTPGSAVTSGSSTHKVLVWYNGTQWTCIGI